MTNITLPLWIFAASVGIPCLFFLFTLMFIMRRIRNPKKDMIDTMHQRQVEDRQASNRKFQNELLSYQIDAVFNGLNAIIDTERIKVRTLLQNNDPMEYKMDYQKREVPAPMENSPAPEEPNHQMVSLEQRIAKMSESGGEADEIANEMGLSQAEVDLALKMRSSRVPGHQGKLHAVA